MNNKLKELLGNKQEGKVILVAGNPSPSMADYLRNFYEKYFRTEVEIESVNPQTIGAPDILINLVKEKSDVLVYVSLSEVSAEAIEIAHRSGCLFAGLRTDREKVAGLWYNVSPNSLFLLEDLEKVAGGEEPISTGSR